MYMYDEILDLIISKLEIEYSGTHNSDRKNPLWGRHAYWRVCMQGHGFVCKVTTPVKSINPKPETLAKLFRAELKRRFEAIQYQATTDHYGQIYTQQIDPYGVKCLLQCVDGKYLQFEQRKQQTKAGA